MALLIFQASVKKNNNAFLSFLLSLIVIFGFCSQISFAIHPANITRYTRKSFPPNFIFGASSSSYQYEGAITADGRGRSVWDSFAATPGNIFDGTNAEVALDFYNRFQDDIKIMKDIGLDAFRLSIAWARIIPTGKLSDGINSKGIFFYNNIINALVSHGIQPLVTIYHWDLPEPLQKLYGGFLSTNITDDLVDFADVCFKEFGDRVKYWGTLNEPLNMATFGFDLALHPPVRCSAWRSDKCNGGDSATEPYIVTHNIILSHAKIVQLYREKYKPYQNGQIGIVLNTDWFVPYSSSYDDVMAAERALDFNYGWFLDPLVFGEYPENMQHLVGDRLPKFTAEQKKLITGSLDFLGINYYSAQFAKNNHIIIPEGRKSWSTDGQYEQTPTRDGIPVGEQTGAAFLYAYPEGLYELLTYTNHKYRNIPVYICENGYAEHGTNTASLGIDNYPGIQDIKRIHFFIDHLSAVKTAIDEGANVKAYFAWSFLDDWEWNSGFNLRFGLVFVDYTDNLKRHYKYSALLFKKILS